MINTAYQSYSVMLPGYLTRCHSISFDLWRRIEITVNKMGFTSFEGQKKQKRESRVEEMIRVNDSVVYHDIWHKILTLESRSYSILCQLFCMTQFRNIECEGECFLRCTKEDSCHSKYNFSPCKALEYFNENFPSNGSTFDIVCANWSSIYIVSRSVNIFG
jgi:hypothetical protein